VPTYRGGTSLQAPLRLQLRVPAGQTARLYSIYAAGDSSTGQGSRPALTRPGTLGVGNSLPTFPLYVATPSRCVLSDAFSVAPSLPSLNIGPFALPIIVNWEAPKGGGIQVGGQGANTGLLLFSNATGGHSWTASFTWEEL
jgi:hypothetical protein